MGWFNKQPVPAEEPVRPEQVRRLAELIRHEDKAFMFDAPVSRESTRAEALLAAAMRHSTPAEYRAALKQADQQHQAEVAPRGPGDGATEPAGTYAYLRTETTSTHITGGATMSSIDEVRAILAASNAKAEGAQGALAHAAQEVREVEGSLMHAAQGSGNAAIQEAMGLYAQIADQAEQLLGLVSAARAAVDAYAASL